MGGHPGFSGALGVALTSSKREGSQIITGLVPRTSTPTSSSSILIFNRVCILSHILKFLYLDKKKICFKLRHFCVALF